MAGFIDYLEANVGGSFVSGGTQYKVNECPFCGTSHGDVRCYVSVKKECGICFHCETSFSAVSYVKAREGCVTSKALAILNGDGDAWARTYEEESEVPRIPYPECIHPIHDDTAYEYLARRHVDLEMIDHFQLGYCTSNIMVKKGEEDVVYHTRKRIIIPIYGIDGYLESWQGRDTTGKSKFKYLFPPGFKGAEYLFNAVNITVGADFIIVAEGVFDVFGWYAAGFRNVVATFGKKISSAQVDILRYLRPKCLFMAWDDDAIKQKYEFCEKYGYLFPNILIVNMGGKDADEKAEGDLRVALLKSRRYSWDEKILALL